MKKTPHIVIIGGGAGGLELATRLGRKLGKKSQAKITLVDKSLTHLWKPLLHEVAAGTIDADADQINYFAHAHQNGFHFVLGELHGLDRKQKQAQIAFTLDDHSQAEQLTLDYDYLIIAIGSESNDFNIPGVKEHCYFLENQEQAITFQHDFINRIIQSHHITCDEDKLQTVIIGGGATGVELAAELHFAIRKATQYGLSQASQQQINISIIEAAPRILAALPERISEMTTKELHRYEINTLTNQRVAKVTENSVITADQQTIPANIIVWAAGIKAPAVLTQLDGLACNTANQLLVRDTLQVDNDDSIFAFGDCAACKLKGSDKIVPARAQAAHQQASLLAKSLIGILKGKAPLSYQYKDYGSLISLSSYETIGQLMGRATRVMIEGKIARLMYLSLHQMHQVALHGWWRVMLLSIAKTLSHRVKPKLKLH